MCFFFNHLENDWRGKCWILFPVRFDNSTVVFFREMKESLRIAYNISNQKKKIHVGYFIILICDTNIPMYQSTAWDHLTTLDIKGTFLLAVIMMELLRLNTLVRCLWCSISCWISINLHQSCCFPRHQTRRRWGSARWLPRRWVDLAL